MNEGYKLHYFPALLLSLTSFIGSFAVAMVMFINGDRLLQYARPENAVERYIPMSEALSTSLSAAVALTFSVYVFRSTRSRVSSAFLFHSCFLIGLALLCYSLWAILVLYRVLGFGSVHMLWATVTSVPFICLFIIPVALLFLVYATVNDNARNA